MSIDLSTPRSMTRLLYPKLPQRLTAADLHQVFSPTYKELEWVPTVARSPSSQVALLVQLRVFQAVGRFLPIKDVPAAGIQYVAQKLGLLPETAKRSGLSGAPPHAGTLTGSAAHQLLIPTTTVIKRPPV